MALAPAYEKITIEPHPSPELGFAKASYESSFGTISSYWYYKENTVCFEFDIPNGVMAYLTLPNKQKKTLTGGRHLFVVSEKQKAVALA